MNFFKAFYITGLTTVLVTVISFLNNIVVTRFLGAEGRGEYSVIMNVILIISLVFGEGIRRSNIIFAGNSSFGLKKVIQRTIRYVVLFAILFMFLLFFKNYFTVDILKVNDKLFALALFITLFLIFWRALQSIFLGLEDYKKFNTLQFVYTSLIFLLNLFVIYILDAGITEIILNFLFSSLIVVVLSFYFLKGMKDNKRKENKTDTQNIVLRATLASIFGFLLLKGDIFYVNYFSDKASTGIYSITLVMTDLFQKLPLILGPIVIARSVNKDFRTEVFNIARMSRVLVFVNFLAVIFLFFFGEWLIKAFFSSQFENSYYLLLYILPSLVVFSSGHVINAFLMGQGFPFIVIFNAFFFSLFDALLDIFLVPLYGVKAAAIVCSTSYMLWALTFIVYFTYKYNLSVKSLLFINKSDFLVLRTKLFSHG